MVKLGWFMSDINRNIPTTWRWARGDSHEYSEAWAAVKPRHLSVSPPLSLLSPSVNSKRKKGIKGLTKIMILIIVKFLRPMVDLSGFNCNKVAVYVWHKSTELPHSFFFLSFFFFLFLCLFLSLWPFQLYFIPWILPTTLRFLTLFFRSCFCLIGPFNSISLYESLLQPWYNPLWLTVLKAPAN